MRKVIRKFSSESNRPHTVFHSRLRERVTKYKSKITAVENMLCLRTAPFWVTTLRVVVISYWSFGTTYWRWGRSVVP